MYLWSRMFMNMTKLPSFVNRCCSCSKNVHKDKNRQHIHVFLGTCRAVQRFRLFGPGLLKQHPLPHFFVFPWPPKGLEALIYL